MHATVRVGGGGDIPHGFIATMPNGYTGPFVRERASSLPIRKLLAIGAPIMASQPSVGPVAQAAMSNALDKAIDQQIKRVLTNAGKT
jgi:hypothetical protein